MARFIFSSLHNYLDGGSGAAITTRSQLWELVYRGHKVQTFCGPLSLMKEIYMKKVMLFMFLCVFCSIVNVRAEETESELTDQASLDIQYEIPKAFILLSCSRLPRR